MIIVIPALERHNYRDLHVLLESIKMYAFGVKVKVYHKGRTPKIVGIKETEFITFIPQWAENKHFGDACRQIVWETGDRDLFFVNDDTVFTPETFPLLQADIATLEKASMPIGLLGLRTNFSAGLQNIRTPHGALVGMRYAMEDMVCEVDTVFGTAFYAPRTALNAVTEDWTQLQWYGDNLLSYDLRQKGYRNFVSRSYIHHHGSQSGKDYSKYDQEGKAWLSIHRPDFPLP